MDTEANWFKPKICMKCFGFGFVSLFWIYFGEPIFQGSYANSEIRHWNGTCQKHNDEKKIRGISFEIHFDGRAWVCAISFCNFNWVTRKNALQKNVIYRHFDRCAFRYTFISALGFETPFSGTNFAITEISLKFLTEIAQSLLRRFTIKKITFSVLDCLDHSRAILNLVIWYRSKSFQVQYFICRKLIISWWKF